MVALSEPRRTQRRSGDRRGFPIAAAVQIFQGALVAVNATGFLVPMTTATALRGVGRAEEGFDNRNGNAGAATINVGAEIFPWENSTGGDAIARKDIGKTAYGIDDQTVALTDGGGTRSVAGTVFDVDEYGVWVKHS